MEGGMKVMSSFPSSISEGDMDEPASVFEGLYQVLCEIDFFFLILLPNHSL